MIATLIYSPQEARELILKALQDSKTVDPNKSIIDVEYVVADTADDRFGGGPSYQCTGVKITIKPRPPVTRDPRD